MSESTGIRRVIAVPAKAAAALLLAFLARGLLAQSGTAPATPPAPFPSDLNHASLRVLALDAIYEFDLSADQLKSLRAAASGTATTQHLKPVKANAELAKAFQEFNAALLAAADPDAIAKLRTQVIKLATDVELDDDIQATDTAMAHAAGFRAKLKASQIAAYMALHADQVTDPVEMTLGAVDSIRDMRTSGTAAGEVDAFITDTANNAAYLVHGPDEEKTKPLAKDIAAWLKSAAEVPEKQPGTPDPAREEELSKLIGPTDPIQVLAHWIDLQLAQLLSNPELPAAIDARLAAKPDAK